jgi:hypothetical protein
VGTGSGGSIADASRRIKQRNACIELAKANPRNQLQLKLRVFQPAISAVLGVSCSMAEGHDSRVFSLLLRCRTLKPLLKMPCRAATQTVHKLETGPCHGQVGFLWNGATLEERYESLS